MEDERKLKSQLPQKLDTTVLSEVAWHTALGGVILLAGKFRATKAARAAISVRLFLGFPSYS